MSDASDDEIAEQLLEGGPYERARLSTKQMVSLSLDGKVLLAVVTLGLSTLLAPGVLVRRDLIRSLEGAGELDLAFGLLALNGILTTFLGGLLLVRQQYVLRERSLTEEQARKLLRLEDLFALVVILGGMFIGTSLLLVAIGLLSPDATETLYANDIRIYRPDEAIGADIRLVSGLGGILAAVLAVLWRLAR